MTDISKYRNVSLSKETYSVLESLSKVLLPGTKLSISKTVEALANTEKKKLNGQKRYVQGVWVTDIFVFQIYL